MKEYVFVPQPDSLRFGAEEFPFSGFKEFPASLAADFKVGVGNWELVTERGDPQTVELEVQSGKVSIKGNVHAGYAYLIQLILQAKGELPSLHLEKQFAFSMRGFHLDVARGGVATVEALKSLVRWLFLLNYNAFFLYVEDLYPWKVDPSIGKARGGYSEGDLAELERYAGDYGIEIIPSLELLGHMENILRGKYAQFADMDGCLDVSNPQAEAFGLSLLSDALSESKSPYVLVGGDETWTLGRGKSLVRSGRYEGPQLYIEYYKKIVKSAKEKGKTAILWGDMATGVYLPPDEKNLWKDVIKSDLWDEVLIANWDYSPSSVDHFKQSIESVGHIGSQIACPGLANWRKFYPDFDTALTNVRNFLQAAKEKGLKRYAVTAWGDDGEECLFSYLYPLALAASEIAEGSGEWEKAWLALSGENERVLEFRKALGKGLLANELRSVIYLNRFGLYDAGMVRDALREALEAADGLALPPDLSFMRDLARLAQDVIERRARVSEYVAVASEYSDLWLSERKPNGLSEILTRFWGSAAVLDRGLQTN